MEHPEIVIPLLIGFLLDALIGDPQWLPHPIRIFGKAIAIGELRLNNGKKKRFRGAILSISLILFTYFFFFILFEFLASFSILFLLVSSLFVFYGLANHSLIRESWKVINVLNKSGVEAARKQLSFIVGRDTADLNRNQIRTAVLETLAENLSDGVIAPMFYYALAGVPGMMAYKMANTLDSMIGYKNQRYREFGFFAAKTDDVLNFIPARLTALFMVVVACSYRGLVFCLKFGNKHSSPNAGYPEAALAGILNCRFGGPNSYQGKLVNKPFIGDVPRKLTNKDVVKTCMINFLTSVLALGALVAIYWI
ncbi:adenosylcobinamide-phosphate synthase CbiB [uncultured Draconibacterium sp.]|uniref:adenosylcobinamide-phosphate synthase CbiB n=1 Tax=uncultured Draconibacterium sp. TaxID=1573823 RepID=UPI0025F2867F|nr:adenosylcobinamide-phosphate synthase CbiB [uncultured Draconibacterium sp.]